VLAKLIAEVVCDVVGSKGRHDADHAAVRHGSGPDRSYTRRSPRARQAPARARRRRFGRGRDDAYGRFADRDPPLTALVMERCSPA
jgi:hypothetical protein